MLVLEKGWGPWKQNSIGRRGVDVTRVGIILNIPARSASSGLPKKGTCNRSQRTIFRALHRPMPLHQRPKRAVASMIDASSRGPSVLRRRRRAQYVIW